MKKMLTVITLAGFTWAVSAQEAILQAAPLSQAIVAAIEDTNPPKFTQAILLEKDLGTLTKPAITQYLELAQAKLQSLTNRIAKRDAQIQQTKKWIGRGAAIGAAGGAGVGQAHVATYKIYSSPPKRDIVETNIGERVLGGIKGAAIGAAAGAAPGAVRLSILYASKKYLERKANSTRQIISWLDQLLATLP